MDEETRLLDSLPPRHPLLDRLVKEAGRMSRLKIQKLKGTRAGDAILALDRSEQLDVVINALHQLVPAAHYYYDTEWRTPERETEIPALQAVGNVVLRRKLPTTDEQLERLTAVVRQVGKMRWLVPGMGLIKLMEDYCKARGGVGRVSPSIREALEVLGDSAVTTKEFAEAARLRKRVDALLAGESRSADELRLAPGEPWADVLLDAARQNDAWKALLLHCEKAKAARPSAAWEEVFPGLLESVGVDHFVGVASEALRQVGKRANREIQLASGVSDRSLVDPDHADLLRGVVWICATLNHPELPGALAAATRACFFKIARHGPRNGKVGNACIAALADLAADTSSFAPAAELGRLRQRVDHPKALPKIDEAIDRAALARGLDRDAFEELVVDTFGMTEVGGWRESLGEATAVVEVDGESARLGWINAQGREVKGPPTAVKREHPQRLKELRNTVRDLSAHLLAQRDRIERLYVASSELRTWTLPVWRERYLDHPLVGALARRLIWRFVASGHDGGDGDEGGEVGGVLGIFHESAQGGDLVDVNGDVLALSGDTRVSLWHPIDSPEDEIAAWRRHLEDRPVCQPFKQAHREIYRLTPVERGTATYSNRFAGQIVRQRQFTALCRARGWRYTPHAIWEESGGEVPTRTCEEVDLEVQFLVEPVGEESGAGTYLYLSTDQVRFSDLAGDGVPLADVPPRLLSELLRDIDLFVSVSSIGTDPEWEDRGDYPAWNTQWRSMSFGELNHTARTRRDLLERLLPKLSFGERCRLSERFAEVDGRLRTYKIHLGSGNVLMAPDDQYLCITIDRNRRPGEERPVLPFAGDGQLSVILSKIARLAHDDEIADPLLLQQIQRKF